jgi:hypothetical protein
LQPLALALALMTQPSIAVVVESDEDPGAGARLRGDLVMRLLEDGFGLSAAAEHRLTVTQDDAGVLLRIEGGQMHETWTIEPGPETAVRLEVVHRSIELVRRLPPDELDAPDDRPRVSIEVRDPDGRMTQPSLAVVDALLERDAVVVSPASEGTWRLCLLSDGTRWAHMRLHGDETCDAAFVLLARADAAPEADLLRTIASLSFEQEADTAIEDEAPALHAEHRSGSSETPPPTPPVRRGPIAFASVSPGVAARIDRPDAWVGVRGGLTHASGFGSALQVGFLPSRATSLSLLDTTLTIGPVWRRAVRKRLAVGVGALFGVLLHRFAFSGRGADTHADFVAELPLWLAWRIVGPLHLGLELGAGLAHRRREHLVDGEPLWRRSAARLSAALIVELAWGPQ